MVAFLDFLKNGKGNSEFTNKLEKAVQSAKDHKEWEVEYMTLFAKIQEEREDAAREAAIKATVNTALKYNISKESLIADLMSEFHLTSEETVEFIKKYEM